MDVDENDKAIMRDNDDLMMMDWLVDIGNMGHNNGMEGRMHSWEVGLSLQLVRYTTNPVLGTRIMVLVVHQ